MAAAGGSPLHFRLADETVADEAAAALAVDMVAQAVPDEAAAALAVDLVAQAESAR